jgi:hypothetical protein
MLTIFLAKLKEKILLSRPRVNWVNNIKIHLKVTELETVNSIHLAEDRGHGSCEHGKESSCYTRSRGFFELSQEA